MLCEKQKVLGRSNTNYRKCIPLEKRVAIALYTLRSSAEYATIANLFGVSKASVCLILKEFCEEVWRVMASDYINAFPLTEGKMKDCIEGFEKLGLPQCFGALGKILCQYFSNYLLYTTVH